MGLLSWLRRPAPAPPAAPDPDDAGQLLGQSLMRLEINTILKDSMTGAPMQPLPHALLDVAVEYAETLHDTYGVSYAEIGARLFGRTDLTPHDMTAALRPTFATFGGIRAIALPLRETLAGVRKQALVADSRAPSGPSRAEVTLDRIIDGCEVIGDVIKRLPTDGLLFQQLGMTRRELMEPGVKLGPYDLSPTAMLRLRKVWEIGTEEIVAQTTIHLTGDVLMRVSPTLLRAENKLLLEIHRDAVAMSTGYWRDLLNAAVTLATGAARALLGARKA